MPKITIRCSPDADDLFMVRALLEGLIDTGRFEFAIDTSPTDALNQLASDVQSPDVIAISIGHYPAVADRYQLLPHGGSLGDGYGPVVVAPVVRTLSELRGKRLAIPGETTTAWLVLRLLLGPNPEIESVVVPIEPYERTFEALRSGEVDAALVIHEGRLTYEDEGMHALVDIGEWWADYADGLPLPLGGNAIRRDLGSASIAQISSLLQQSIAHALAHRDDAIAWLLARGGALKSKERLSQYLSMYANQATLDYGARGRRSVEILFERAAEAGLLDRVPVVDFAP